MWTARDCELVHRNGSHARCRCSRTGTFGVLMDASPREVGLCSASQRSGRVKGQGCPTPHQPCLSPQRLEGDLELLAVFTHVVVAVSVAALLLTAAILLSLRSLKSNMRGIHANVAAALGVAELLFLLGIHRTQNQVQGQDHGTCDLMTLPGPGRPGAKVQGQRSGMLRLGPGFGARILG